MLSVFILNSSGINFAQKTDESKEQRFSIESEKPAGRYSSKDKAIHIQTFLGPFGSAYIPPEILSQQNVFQLLKKGKTELDVEKYFFPSIYFVISAKPNIYISKQEQKKPRGGGNGSDFIDYEFSKGGQNLTWMRVSITLEPVACKAEYGQELTPVADADSIKVMAIAPEDTEEVLKESRPAQFARVGDELVNKVIPFVSSDASLPTPTKLTAASGAVSILFKNLFPPRSVANSYAFIDSDISLSGAGKDTFGWYWRQNNSEQKPESIVGLRRSVAFLQVKRGVRAIKVSYRIDAKWDGDYSDKIDDEYVDADTIPYADLERGEDKAAIKFDRTYCLPPPTPPDFFEDIEYDFLPHLDEFPMLVPREVVCNIFHKEVAPIYFGADDITNPLQLLRDLRDTGRPALTLLWKYRNKEILEKLKITNENDWNNEIGKLRPDYKLRQLMSEELNVLLRDKKGDFYRTMKEYVDQGASGLSGATKELWNRATTHGSSGHLFLFYRRAFAELYPSSLRDYDPDDECTLWFRNEFSGQIIHSSGDDFTHRELIKKRLEVPTLKEENDALKNLLKPKPVPSP